MHKARTSFSSKPESPVKTSKHSRLSEDSIPREAVDWENLIHVFNIRDILQMTPEEEEEFLAKIEVLDLYDALVKTNNDLNKIELENFYLTQFLQDVNPKSLMGMDEKRLSLVENLKESSLASSMSKPFNDDQRTIDSKSLFSSATTYKIGDLLVTHRTRCDIVEKVIADLETEITQFQRDAYNTFKRFTAEIDELKMTVSEIQSLNTSFITNYLTKEHDIKFFERANERTLENHFISFIQTLEKNVTILRNKMRLRLRAIHEICQRIHEEIQQKIHLKGVVTMKDYELLQVKYQNLKNEFQAALDDYNGMKRIAARTGLKASGDNVEISKLEKEYIEEQKLSSDLKKHIENLNKEIRTQENTLRREQQTERKLKFLLGHYHAPTIEHYIEMKEEFAALEKEAKAVDRKIHIANMKLANRMSQRREMLNRVST